MGLLEGLAAIDAVNQYLLYSYVEHAVSVRAPLPRGKNFRFDTLRFAADHWKQMWFRAELPPQDALEPVDVIHSLFFNAPPEHHGSLVATIYDVSFLLYPEFHVEANRLHCLNGTMNAALYADRIIAVSQQTKRDIMNYFSVAEDRIRVTHLAPRKVFYPERNLELIRRTLQRLAIYENFILFVGTLEPRKNLRNLLEAYARYVDSRVGRELLVVVGARGWGNENVYHMVSELGLERHVRFLGHVPESDLRVLYSVAKVFVYPSFYEGFGLPPLEAMACGAPVIASNTSSLPEVVGDAGMLINPGAVEELYAAMRTVLTDEDLRLQGRRRALERAKHFSWEQTARETLAVYQELCG